MNEKIIAFDKALKNAEKELTLQYYDSKPENIYALINHASEPLFRVKIISFIESSFDVLRKVAYDKKTEDDKAWNDGYESSVMINHVVFGALVRTAAMIEGKELIPLLYKEFIGIQDAFYELSLENGTLCIALSILGYEGAVNEILNYLDEAVSNEYSIDQNQEVLEMFYGYCLIKKDKTRALNYLNNPKRTKNLSLVAAALADLDAKEGLPILKDRLTQLDNPFAKEAFLEAIHRLETQKHAPAPSERMIWMFGKRSRTEMDLGEESDNEFVLRVLKQTGTTEIDEYYESFY
jgi:hypothetical protein